MNNEQLLASISEAELGIDIFSDSLTGAEIYVSVDKLRQLVNRAHILGIKSNHES